MAILIDNVVGTLGPMKTTVVTTPAASAETLATQTAETHMEINPAEVVKKIGVVEDHVAERRGEGSGKAKACVVKEQGESHEFEVQHEVSADHIDKK
jgi:hypothetical protein